MPEVDDNHDRVPPEDASSNPEQKTRRHTTWLVTNPIFHKALENANAPDWFLPFSQTDWDAVLKGEKRAAGIYVRTGLLQKSVFCTVLRKTQWLPSTWTIEDEEDEKLVLAKLRRHEEDEASVSSCAGFVVKASRANRGENIGFCESAKDVEAFLNRVRKRSSCDAEPDAGDDSFVDAREEADENTPKTKAALVCESGTKTNDEYLIQEYVPPLLLESYENRKFHLRALVLVAGNPKTGGWHVFLHVPSIACLFAKEQYRPLGEDDGQQSMHLQEHEEQEDHDPEAHEEQLQEDEMPTSHHSAAHLTNCCVSQEHSVPLIDLADEEDRALLLKKNGFNVVAQIKACLRDVFALYEKKPLFFCPLPHCVELYGFDFLVQDSGEVKVLEANSGPSFAMYEQKVADGIVRDMLSVVSAVQNLERPLVLDTEFGTDSAKEKESMARDGEKGILQFDGFREVFCSNENKPLFGATTLRSLLEKFQKRINSAGSLIRTLTLVLRLGTGSHLMSPMTRHMFICTVFSIFAKRSTYFCERDRRHFRSSDRVRRNETITEQKS
ncbi:unnamed protein product, partial [Amoebophrya sp. A120]|eukprot:GSA120T00003035001.1